MYSKVRTTDQPQGIIALIVHSVEIKAETGDFYADETPSEVDRLARAEHGTRQDALLDTHEVMQAQAAIGYVTFYKLIQQKKELGDTMKEMDLKNKLAEEARVKAERHVERLVSEREDIKNRLSKLEEGMKNIPLLTQDNDRLTQELAQAERDVQKLTSEKTAFDNYVTELEADLTSQSELRAENGYLKEELAKNKDEIRKKNEMVEEQMQKLKMIGDLVKQPNPR